MTLPCFRCGTDFEHAFGDDIGNQPWRGTIFASHGNYGSTVFDNPRSGEYIEISICDACLLEHREMVLFYEPPPVREAILGVPWTPGPRYESEVE